MQQPLTYTLQGEYLPKPSDFDNEHDMYWYTLNDKTNKLPGMGGVFNPVNLNAYQYAGNNPVKFVDPDGNQQFYSPVNRLAAYIDMRMKDSSKTTGVDYQTTATYESNTFDQLMKIGLTELTQAGTIARVGLGLNPYTHEKLKMSDRLKEAGVVVLTGGAGAYFRVGSKLYALKGSRQLLGNTNNLNYAINKALKAMDYRVKSGAMKIGEKGVHFYDKTKSTYRGYRDTFPD